MRTWQYDYGLPLPIVRSLRADLEHQEASQAMRAMEMEQKLAKALAEQRTRYEHVPELLRREHAQRTAKAKAEHDALVAQMRSESESELAELRAYIAAELEKRDEVERDLKAKSEKRLRMAAARMREETDALKERFAHEHDATLECLQGGFIDCDAELERLTAVMAMRDKEHEASQSRSDLSIRMLETAAADLRTTIGQMRVQATREAAVSAETIAQRERSIDELKGEVASGIAAAESAAAAHRDEVASLLRGHETQIGALTTKHANDTSTMEARHATELADAHEKRAIALNEQAEAHNAIVAEKDGTIQWLKEDLQAHLTALEKKHETVLIELESRHAAKMREAEERHEETLRLVAERDATIARLNEEAAKATEARAALVKEKEMQVAALTARGRIKVHLSHASGLRAADMNGLSDPFVTLRLGKKTERSTTQSKTLEPKFGMDFVFGFASVDAAINDTMIVEVWDSDTVSDDDKIGGGALRLVDHRSALEGGETVKCAVDLTHKKESMLSAKTMPAGQVFVELSWEFQSQGLLGELEGLMDGGC